MALAVCEIFYSLQGESTYAGRPCAFVRLSGCNLRCRYCDTTYAYNNGSLMEVEQILNSVGELGAGLVEITGGEPLIQEQTPELAVALLERGYRVLIETNGTQDISRIDSRCIRIVDIKCPSSGHSNKNDLENLNRLTPCDELKFVVADRADYEYARTIFFEKILSLACHNAVHFSPVYGRMTPAELGKWILADRLGQGARLQLQLHKLLWPEAGRGV